MIMQRGQIIIVLFSVWMLAAILPNARFAPANRAILHIELGSCSRCHTPVYCREGGEGRSGKRLLIDAPWAGQESTTPYLCLWA